MAAGEGLSLSTEVEDQPPPPSSSPPTSGRKKRGGWRAIKYILGNESFEKLASMSLIANITVYLHTRYNLEGVMLVNVVQIWSGTCNIMTLFGAFLSDAYLGRFNTLLFGSIASLLGMATFTMTAGVSEVAPTPCPTAENCEQAQNWQLAILFGGLALLAIGAGGIRPCNIAFGADQFDTTTKKGRAQLESFFNWWYFSFTVTLVIALTAVVYIQSNVSWVVGFAIPTACLAISITIFLFGQHTYIYHEPKGSVFVDVVKVSVAAFHKRKEKVDENNWRSCLYDPELDELRAKTEKLEHSSGMFACLDKAALIKNPAEELDEQGKPKDKWRLCSVQQVEQLKGLVGIAPVWITAIGIFLTMDQQSIFGILQAIQMDRKIGSSFEVPPGWMGLTSMLALSLWILLYEQLYIPQAKKITKKDGRMTMRLRINLGILMSIICMIVAGIIEKKRRSTALQNHTFGSPMRVGWLLPQFILSGMVEAFGAVAIMEYFTVTLPDTMRTIAGSIFFLSISIGSYTSSLIVTIVHRLTGWVGNHDLNEDKLERYYAIVACIALLNLVYFNVYGCKYLSPCNKISDSHEPEEENSSRSRHSS
uniref:Uncharacterized protein n=1 Tax=Kalanchoe fedtschenkoi TaxID=63787 RepID=A0A7N0TYI8_KALFE